MEIVQKGGVEICNCVRAAQTKGEGGSRAVKSEG